MTVLTRPPNAQSPAARGVALRMAVLAAAVATVLFVASLHALSTAAAVLACAAALAGWTVAVLRAELERIVAIVLLPVALVAGLGAAGWIYAVQPVINRLEQRIDQLERIGNQVAHPDVAGKVSDGVGSLVDRAKNAVGGAR